MKRRALLSACVNLAASYAAYQVFRSFQDSVVEQVGMQASEYDKNVTKPYESAATVNAPLRVIRKSVGNLVMDGYWGLQQYLGGGSVAILYMDDEKTVLGFCKHQIDSSRAVATFYPREGVNVTLKADIVCKSDTQDIALAVGPTTSQARQELQAVRWGSTRQWAANPNKIPIYMVGFPGLAEGRLHVTLGTWNSLEESAVTKQGVSSHCVAIANGYIYAGNSGGAGFLGDAYIGTTYAESKGLYPEVSITPSEIVWAFFADNFPDLAKKVDGPDIEGMPNNCRPVTVRLSSAATVAPR